MSINNGFGVSHKLLASKESNASVDVGVLQFHHGCSGAVTETTCSPYKIMMRPFSSCDGGVVDSVSNTVCNNSSNNNITAGGGGGAGGAAFGRTLQLPFSLSSISSSSHYNLSPFIDPVPAFKSPGGGMAASLSLGFPFTHAQYIELERQALIYKYMVSSVPVPDYLLLPLVNKAYPDPFPPQYSLNDGLRVRFSSNGDPEPGRCKRTDGKKWRCARDAAPGQKYCERHLHRGRPRSRKHVELVPSNSTTTTNKKTRLVQPTTQVPLSISNLRKCSSGVNSSTFPGTISSQPYSATSLSFGSLAAGSPCKEPRELNWLMSESAAAEMQDHQWQHMLVNKTGSATETSSVCDLNSLNFHHHSTEQPLSLNSSKEYSTNQMDDYNNSTLFLNSDNSPLDKSTNEEAPRGLVDAWSNGSSHPKLSLSSLTLSMGGSGFGDSESGPPTTENDRGSRSQASWISSSPGGPLAEVLGSSILNQNSCNASNTSSPRGTNEEPSSSLTATISSPSRVLQKTLASMSDSSGGSSPTLAGSMAKPEFTLQWFNPNKLSSSN